MEKQSSFKRPAMEKQLSFHNPLEKQQSSRMEKQKSFRGLMERQRSIRIAMEKQLSFGRERPRGRESPGKRGDSQLHLAARAGNIGKVKEMFQNCDSQAAKLLISKQNLDGETALYAAAENGHANIVSEFLKYLDLHTASIVAKNNFDPFHVATKQGHLEVLKELLQAFPNLAMTTDSSNTTPLQTAATQGHVDVVNLLLETDSDLAKIARNNGKTALHSAARGNHLEVVKSLLGNDPTTGFRIDRKGQTALHMAVKGQSLEIVHQLLKPDPSILSLEDGKGNTALHVATTKGKTEMVRCLLSAPSIDLNATNKAGESPLDIAEKSGNVDIATILKEAGALRSKGIEKPPSSTKQFKQTVSDIKHGVQSQLWQTNQTRARVQKIRKRLQKLHTSGLNNAINSSIIVAVLIATVAFAAIFSIPGQYVESKTDGYTIGEAHIAKNAAFIVFLITDSLALFISLAVVVVQTSVVVVAQKEKKMMMSVINKLMWVACLFISIAFIAITFVVVGSEARWLAVYAVVAGCVIMLTTIGSMCYCVIVHQLEEKKLRNTKRVESRSRSFSVSVAASDPEIDNNEYKTIFAL